MGDESLRLSDFGLIKNLDPSESSLRRGAATMTGESLGTPGYMSPEQFANEPVSESTDVYSLGVILAELALGRRPEVRINAKNGSTLQDDVELQKLASALAKLIRRATDVEPDKRYANAQALLEAFERVVGKPA